jgi:secretion/DNA translocation related TadE-like protein
VTGRGSDGPAVVTGRASDGSVVLTAGLGIRARSTDQRGSATVVMLGVIAAVLMLTVSGLLLASAVLASHRARAAADLGALAAAGVLIRGEPAGAACESAAQVAAANHGRVQVCIASGTEVRLTVTVASGVTGLGVATARSRAGPGPSGN